MQEFLRWQEEG